MNARKRFWLAICVLGALMTGPFLLTVLVVLLDMRPGDREVTLVLLKPHLPLGTLLTLTGFVAGVQVLRWLFRQYVQGLRRMAEHLHLMQTANRNFRIAPEGPPEVVAVAEAANQLACQRDALMDDVERKIAAANAAVEFEKTRLVALVSQLATGVLVCNRDGRIVLYNPRAKALFCSTDNNPAARMKAPLLGLGRSIYGLLHKGVIDHAKKGLANQIAAGASAPVANFVTATRSGLLLRVHLSVVVQLTEQTSPEIQGYVFSLEDITRTYERKARKNSALRSFTEDAQLNLATVRNTLSSLEGKDREGIGAAHQHMERTLEHLEKRLRQLDASTSRSQTSGMEDILAADMIAAARRKITLTLPVPVKLDSLDESLWLHADSFSILQALCFLAGKLHEHYEVRELRLGLDKRDEQVLLSMGWIGPPLSSETLYTWKLEPIDGEAGPASPSLKEVLDRHHGDLVYQRGMAKNDAVLHLSLPSHTGIRDLISHGETENGTTPEYFDFNLLRHSASDLALEHTLATTAFTVFDTETTGLSPTAGDEIIQIGAVRILNGRVLHQENFDTLINPQFPIPAASTEIHGITDEMVANAPAIDIVLPAFHGFCSESILVAHNAAFDMRFLELKQERTGVQFVQPVLDTLLLSSIVHPGQESHKLEDIAQRLGVIAEGRHTALSDARMTAEIFIRLIPLLEDRGIRTVKQALDASAQSPFARITY